MLEMPTAIFPSPLPIQGAVVASNRIAVTHVVEQVRLSKALSPKPILINRPLRESDSIFMS